MSKIKPIEKLLGINNNDSASLTEQIATLTYQKKLEEKRTAELDLLTSRKYQISSTRREFIYLILSIVFGFVFSLAATAFDTIIKIILTNEIKDMPYFIYSIAVILEAVVIIVFMLSVFFKMHRKTNILEESIKKTNEYYDKKLEESKF